MSLVRACCSACYTECVTNLQVRNVPDEIMDALREEASEHGRSVQQHVLTVLDEHTSGTRLRSLFARLDSALEDEPVLTTDPADAVRADRDASDHRDGERADEYA